jgi:type II secretory pathway pseudopilin PulG
MILVMSIVSALALAVAIWSLRRSARLNCELAVMSSELSARELELSATLHTMTQHATEEVGQ